MMIPEVSARAFIGFAKMVKGDFGPPAWDALLGSMKAPEHRIYDQKINGAQYFPYSSYLALLELLKPLYGNSTMAYHTIGEKGAMVDFGTDLLTFSGSTADQFFKNAAMFWSSYYRGLGNLEVIVNEPTHGLLKVVGTQAIERPHALVVTGWMYHILKLLGFTQGVCRLIEKQDGLYFDLSEK